MRKILLAIALVFLPSAALATGPTTNAIVTAQTPNRGIVQFLQGTDVAGTYKTLYTAGLNGSRCNALWLTTTDATATHLVTIQIVNGGVKYGGTAITTTLGAGFVTGLSPIAVFQFGNWPGLPLDSDGNPYIQLVSGDTLQATFATALTSTTLINLVATCSDF